MGKKCKCGTRIPYKVVLNGKEHKTPSSRKYCYACRPRKGKIVKKTSSKRRKRKMQLVKMLGGKCVHCGYKRSITAISFHHLYPKDKCFDISNGGLMKGWKELIQEAKKCELLCLNCHAELHNDS